MHFCSPLYSTEVMEEAIEPLSQSLSMFLLDALLSTGNESIEQTDPALEDNQSLYVKQLNNNMEKREHSVSSTLRS